MSWWQTTAHQCVWQTNPILTQSMNSQDDKKNPLRCACHGDNCIDNANCSQHIASLELRWGISTEHVSKSDAHNRCNPRDFAMRKDQISGVACVGEVEWLICLGKSYKSSELFFTFFSHFESNHLNVHSYTHTHTLKVELSFACFAVHNSLHHCPINFDGRIQCEFIQSSIYHFYFFYL